MSDKELSYYLKKRNAKFMSTPIDILIFIKRHMGIAIDVQDIPREAIFPLQLQNPTMLRQMTVEFASTLDHGIIIEESTVPIHIDRALNIPVIDLATASFRLTVPGIRDLLLYTDLAVAKVPRVILPRLCFIIFPENILVLDDLEVRIVVNAVAATN